MNTTHVTRHKREQKGVALIMVLLVIAITSALTFYIGSSIYFSSRLHQSFIQRAQAEYLLKSALNVARAMVSQAKGDADPPPNSWGQLAQGIEVDGAMLGITLPNITVGLEINSVDSKLSLFQLIDKSIKTAGGSPASGNLNGIFIRWREIFVRLFQRLGFDNDNERVYKGPFKGTFYGSQALVANLIDYMDEDTVSYNDSGFQPGIESSVGKDTFANREIRNFNELESIPGFTPARLKKLTPFITLEKADRININLVSATVLMALSSELNENSAQEIIDYARGPNGPYTGNTYPQQIQKHFTSQQGFDDFEKITTIRSTYLQVISKIRFGTSKYFLRSIIMKQNGVSSGVTELPEVIKTEFFG
jgi:type II secretory pathway component PulK